MLLEGLGIHLLTPLQTICAFEAQMLCKELEIKKTERAKYHWQGQIIASQIALLTLFRFRIIVQLSVSKLVSLT